MIRQYFTLCKLAEELRQICGSRLTECFTQEKETAYFRFESNNKIYFLECSIATSGAMFLRPDFNRAKKNTLDLFPALFAQEVQNVEIAEHDRIISFDFPNGILHFCLFGSASGNILLTDDDDKITDAFKHPKTFFGTQFQTKSPDLKRLSEFSADTKLETALSSILKGGKIYATEICFCLGENPVKLLENLSFDEIFNIEQAVFVLRREILASKKFDLVRTKRDDLTLSLVPLHSENDFLPVVASFSSVSEAIRARISRQTSEKHFSVRKNEILRNLSRRLTKIERALQAMEEEKIASSRSEERQLFGELLMSQKNLHTKGQSLLETEDWNGEIVQIRLKSELSLLENAEEYFKKARTAKEAKIRRGERFFGYQNEKIILENAIKQLNFVLSQKMLDEFLRDFYQLFRKMDEQEEKKGSAYREFELEGGYTVYVGKSAANNDELTMRFAKPNDWWFHARGVSGSHVVLRGSGGEKPPKHILQQTAAIAAWYSKAKNAKFTPVAFTQKKYVRKSKGANVGAVVIEREEVVMVQPTIPAGAKE